MESKAPQHVKEVSPEIYEYASTASSRFQPPADCACVVAKNYPGLGKAFYQDVAKVARQSYRIQQDHPRKAYSDETSPRKRN